MAKHSIVTVKPNGMGLNDGRSYGAWSIVD